jgi:hypothetical protein
MPRPEAPRTAARADVCRQRTVDAGAAGWPNRTVRDRGARYGMDADPTPVRHGGGEHGNRRHARAGVVPAGHPQRGKDDQSDRRRQRTARGRSREGWARRFVCDSGERSGRRCVSRTDGSREGCREQACRRARSRRRALRREDAPPPCRQAMPESDHAGVATGERAGRFHARTRLSTYTHERCERRRVAASWRRTHPAPDGRRSVGRRRRRPAASREGVR